MMAIWAMILLAVSFLESSAVGGSCGMSVVMVERLCLGRSLRWGWQVMLGR
jgi:hypothetical protein